MMRNPPFKLTSHRFLKSVGILVPVTLVLITALGLIPGLASPTAVWLDVPFVKQATNLCGAASISMVMQYWSVIEPYQTAQEVPAVKKIGAELFSYEHEGIFGRDMEAYFQTHGFRTFVFKGSWNDLQHHLSLGRPLIACLRLSGRDGRYHYVVVAGLDPNQNFLRVNDPARKRLRKLARQTFEQMWGATNNWTLLALPHPTSPDKTYDRGEADKGRLRK